MKLPLLFLALATSGAYAQASAYKNTVRQIQQDTGVVWDMTNVAANGSGSSALLLESGGSLFQLWTIHQTTAQDYLLDQKLVGAYLPKAEVVIKTPDPHTGSVRTRVDKGFTVEFNVSDLIAPGTGIPTAATKVLVNQHAASYAAGTKSPGATAIAAKSPTSSFYISQNGKTTLNFPASTLPAAASTPNDPTTANGEEHFFIHVLADDKIAQSQIASAKVEVFPVASGEILGITKNAVYRSTLPTVQVNMKDLYPRSDTYFMLYEGGSMTGKGTRVFEFPWTSDVAGNPVARVLSNGEINALITKDGEYTLALMSTTVYGTELLADPVPFRIHRSMELNAMQVQYSEGSN